MSVELSSQEDNGGLLQTLRGLVTLLVCSLLMVSVVYGTILFLTAPDGFLTRAVAEASEFSSQPITMAMTDRGGPSGR